MIIRGAVSWLGSVLYAAVVASTALALVVGAVVVANAATATASDDAMVSAARVIRVDSAVGRTSTIARRDAVAPAALPVGGTAQTIRARILPGPLTKSVRRVSATKKTALWQTVVSDLRGSRRGWVLSARVWLPSGRAVPPQFFSVRSVCRATAEFSAPGVRSRLRRDRAARPLLCVKNGQLGPNESTGGVYTVVTQLVPRTPKAKKLTKRVQLRVKLR